MTKPEIMIPLCTDSDFGSFLIVPVPILNLFHKNHNSKRDSSSITGTFLGFMEPFHVPNVLADTYIYPCLKFREWGPERNRGPT